MEHNPVLKNPLSLDSEIPLYSQLMGIIKRSITSGALKVGDLLRGELFRQVETDGVGTRFHRM